MTDPATSDDATARRPSTKIKPNKPLPTDRLKFEKQTAALQAIAIGSANGTQSVDAKKLAGLIHVGEATAPLNNSFFLDVGLITRKGKGEYLPTPLTLEFARQLSFKKANAGQVLADAFRQTWFFQAVSERLAMSNATKAQVIESLSSVAGADASYRPQLGSVLEWLSFVGLIGFDGDEVLLMDEPPASDVGDELVVEDHHDGGPDTSPGAKGKKPTEPQKSESPTVLALSIEFTLSVDDLAILTAEQVTALFQGVGQVASIKAALA